MRALFLTDAEMAALVKILKAGIIQVPGGNMWMRKSIAGPEHNYVHGKLLELCRHTSNHRHPEDKRRDMAVKRERRAALKMAKQALGVG